MMSLGDDFHPEVCAVVGTERVAENLELLRVVHAWNGLHEMGGGVVAEVGADVAHTQAPVARLQVLRMLVRRFVKGVDL